MKKVLLPFVLCISTLSLWVVVDKNWRELELFFSSHRTKDMPAQELNNKRKRIQVYDTISFERLGAIQFYEATPEEIAADQAFEAEQIELAKQWLLDLNLEKRIAGLEQLTAYPSPQSEGIMLEILNNDMSDEMRASAADYLSYIQEPSLKAQDVLIQALNDTNEEVRNSAFNTVQSYIYSLEEDSASAKRLVNLLKKQAKNKQLPADMRDMIKEYLIDQFGS